MNEAATLGSYAPRVAARLETWDRTQASDRVWKKDPTFWPEADPKDVATRLGWLTLPQTMREQADDLRQFALEMREDGFEHAVLLGMGGSSLAPEVFARTFGSAPGFPDLTVLDSTHPDAVGSRIRSETAPRTLFIVSSKSGTTLEPNAFFRYAWSRLVAVNHEPGGNFVAITDPGTPLEALAERRKFRRVFRATPDVGGRYSALTSFGLVPAAVVGHDVRQLLDPALRMSERCGPSTRASVNPGLVLGATLGELALAGRDKIVFLTSRGIHSFPSWTEQLIAESLGKRGRGIVPVPDEPHPTDPLGGRDAVLVDVRLRAETDNEVDSAIDKAASAGTPVLRFAIDRAEELGQEIFRWEMAIASAGAVIGVNPFDQPDVELAKELAREAMKPAEAGSAPSASAPSPLGTAAPEELHRAVSAWLGLARPGDYIAVQAFLSPTDPVFAEIRALSERLRVRARLATTVGIGPRFLHSTGQLHKGGPPSGMFLQLIDRPARDLEVPEMAITFARILRAQADGDALALLEKQRRLLRIDVGTDAPHGIRALADAVGPA